jgi:apolipoprotein N-acyltransferase
MRTILAKAMILTGIVAATAVMQMLIAPPSEYVWLHPFCWVGAFLWINQCRPLGAFASGWLIGTMANIAIFRWIMLVWPTRPLLMNVALLLGYGLFAGLYLGFFALGWQRVRRISGRWWPVGIAVWFTACEFINPQFFPYSQGCAWYRQTWIFPVVGLTGISFLTFVVILCNCLLAVVAVTALRRDALPRIAWVGNTGVFAACLAVSLGWSAWQVHHLDAQAAQMPGLRMALVQPEDHPRNFDEPELHRLIRMTREAVEADPSIQVAVWGEGSLWKGAKEDEVAYAQGLAGELGIEIWTGAHFDVDRPDGSRDCYNSAVRIDATGEGREVYDKSLLAPFYESFPLSNTFPSLDRFRSRGKLTRGKGPVLCETPFARMAFLVCYEAVHYSFVRSVMQVQPDLLVVVSADTWGGWGNAMTQTFMVAAVNAAQYGVPLVRCACGGVCGMVDAVGRVHQEDQTGQSGVLVGTVQPCRTWAPVVWLGNWFALGCAAIALMMVAGLFVPQRCRSFWARCRARTVWGMSGNGLRRVSVETGCESPMTALSVR